MNTAADHLLPDPPRQQEETEEMNIYALLVGIDDYQGDEIPSLSGCLADVQNVASFLQERYGDRLKLKQLVDQDATYSNVIQAFEEHLVDGGGAAADTYWFHFSGHGSEQFTAKEFFEPQDNNGNSLPSLSPNGKDQTLVCYNALGDETNIFLADKELAALLHKLNEKGAASDTAPHILVTLDCCHSGTGTRAESDMQVRKYQYLKNEADRNSLENPTKAIRSLDSYYKECYVEGNTEDQSNLIIPNPRHLLISACTNLELAGDTGAGGIFTTSLIEAFKEKSDINYVDLFTRTRARSKAKRKEQNPQFEPVNNFNPYTKVLEGWRLGGPGTFEVKVKGNNDRWYVRAGAINGLIVRENEKPRFLIYEYEDRRLVGMGEIKRVGIQTSRLEWVKAFITASDGTFTLSEEALIPQENTAYVAEIFSLPAAAQLVLLKGQAAAIDSLTSQWAERQNEDSIDLQSLAIHATRGEEASLSPEIEIQAETTIAAEGTANTYRIIDAQTGRAWVTIDETVKDPVEVVKYSIDKIVRWKRMLALTSSPSELSNYYDLELLTADYFTFQAAGEPHPVEERAAFIKMMTIHQTRAREITLELEEGGFFKPEGSNCKALIPFLFKVRTKAAGKKLYFYLYDLLEDCAINLHESGEVFFENTTDGQELYFGNDFNAFQAYAGQGESHYWFKLFVTELPIEASALTQAGFSADKGILGVKSSGVKRWYCETIKVKIKRNWSWDGKGEQPVPAKGIAGIESQFGFGYFYKAKNYLLAIAVNHYEDHPRIPHLYNCINDSQDLITLLTEDFEFERANVRLLSSGEINLSFQDVHVGPATEEVIFRELRSLGKTIKEEQTKSPNLKINLILYYSGHGTYDDFLEQGYWIPADAELDDYAKYISNSTIRDFLNGIPTHHTFLLSDSCFSGSLFAISGGKSIGSSRLERDASRWGLTAGRNEVVSDGPSGTNSPFAQSVLEVLKQSKTMGVQQLCTIVLEKVAADQKQTPRGEPLRVRGHEGGQFIFRKKINATKHYEAGQLLLELAERRPEYERYRAAANQFSLARRLEKNKNKKINYGYWEAEALCAAGELEKAAALLSNMLTQLDEDVALKYKLMSKLGILHGIFAYPWEEEAASIIAEEELLSFFRELKVVEDQLIEVAIGSPPFDVPLEDLQREERRKIQPVAIRKIMQGLGLLPNRRLFLLTVGINRYPQIEGPDLAGCINDTTLLAETLQELVGEQSLKTHTLTDETATKNNILTTLESIGGQVTEDDIFILHCSAYSIPSKEGLEQEESTPLMYCFDSELQDGELINTISSQTMHEAMMAIPVASKVLILDLCGNNKIVEWAEQGDYALLLGATGSEMAGEISKNNKSYGVFSWSLAAVLGSRHREGTFSGEALLKTMEEARKSGKQTPVLIREDILYKSLPNFAGLPMALEFLYGPRRYLSKDEVREIVKVLKGLSLNFSIVEKIQVAKRLASLGALQDAARLYAAIPLAALNQEERIKQQLKEAEIKPWAVLFDIAKVFIRLGEAKRASLYVMESLKYEEEIGPALKAKMETLLQKMVELGQTRKYALLVGIDEYAPGNIPNLKSAKKDAANWKKKLQELGYRQDDITILEDSSATTSNILHEFDNLVQHSKTNPTFFFFAGFGTAIEAGQGKAILAYDSHASHKKPSDISLHSLVERSQEAKNLTIVLDTGFHAKGDRFVPGCITPATRALWESGEIESEHMNNGLLRLAIGNACVIPGIICRNVKTKEEEIYPACSESRIGGMLSLKLIENLNSDTRYVDELAKQLKGIKILANDNR